MNEENCGALVKNCPFCGEPPIIREGLKTIYGSSVEASLIYCGVCKIEKFGTTLEEALDNWNKRKPDSRIPYFIMDHSKLPDEKSRLQLQEWWEKMSKAENEKFAAVPVEAESYSFLFCQTCGHGSTFASCRVYSDGTANGYCDDCRKQTVWKVSEKYNEAIQNLRFVPDFFGVDILFLKALARSGISKQELAEKIGVSPSQITRWLAPNTNMTLASLFSVAKAIGIEIEIKEKTTIPFPFLSLQAVKNEWIERLEVLSNAEDAEQAPEGPYNRGRIDELNQCLTNLVHVLSGASLGGTTGLRNYLKDACKNADQFSKEWEEGGGEVNGAYRAGMWYAYRDIQKKLVDDSRIVL